MGNQLSATPSVRIANVSSSLYLISPLGGENRNFFSTFHCLDRSETDSLSLKLLVRCNRSNLYRIHNNCNRNEKTSHSNFSDVYHYLEGNTSGVCVDSQQPVADTFFPSGSLKVSLSNYTQFLLRRPVRGGGKDANKDGDPRAPGDYTNANFSRTGGLYPSGTWSLYSGHSGGVAMNPLGSPQRRAISPVVASDPAFPPQTTVRVRDVVVKVFVRNSNDHDQALALKEVSRLLHSMSEHIAAAARAVHTHESPISILFYDTIRSEESDMFCLLQRPYVDFSLAERLATRPFYTLEDRLFACYQVLQGLVQLHEQYGMVHGDLKPSNVLVQSGSGWLYLSDIAPFKPSRVPADNPAVFDYYYDTDDTRCCCLAPEKFYDSKLKPSAPLSSALSTATMAQTASSPTEMKTQTLLVEPVGLGFSPIHQSRSSFSSLGSDAGLDNMNVYGHTSAMDVFSAGCVMVYLLTDEPAFSLSEVLQLRERETDEARRAFVAQILADRGVDGPLLEMLLSVLCALPEERPSARQILESFTPSVFPRSYRVLYEKVLPSLLARPPDHQAQILFKQLRDIFCECAAETLTNGCRSGESKEVPHTVELQKSAIYQLEAHRAVHLLLPLLLHATRRASTDEATFRGVVCLRQVALPQCKLSTQLDMVLPHLLYIVNSRAEFGVNTRIVALRAVCEIVGRVVEELSRDASTACVPYREKDSPSLQDDNLSSRCFSGPGGVEKQLLGMSARIQQTTLLDDLILPCICELLENSSREEVGFLTELANRLPQLLLEARYCLEQRQTIFGIYKIENRQGTFGQQLDVLCNNGWYMFQAPFRLSLAPVSVAFLHQVPKVAAFLGDARTQEDMIPFLTTAISSPVQVRREVYPIAILLHSVLQCPQIKTLHFFVEEGLRQNDTVCLKRTLDALAVVVRARKFTSWDSMTLVHLALPLVASPFRPVNIAARKVIEVAARTFRASEVLVYLESATRPLLTQVVPLTNLSSLPDSVIRQNFPSEVPDAQKRPLNSSSRETMGMGSFSSGDGHPYLRQQWRTGTAVETHSLRLPLREFCYPTKAFPHRSTTALLRDIRDSTKPKNVTYCDVLLDLTLDQGAVEPPTRLGKNISQEDVDEGAVDKASSCGFRYQPPPRERQRMQLRQSILFRHSLAIFSTSSSPRLPLGSLPPASSYVKMTPSREGETDSCDVSPEGGAPQLGPSLNASPALSFPSSPSATAWLPPSWMGRARKELRPLGVAHDTKWRHIGGIYTMESLPCGRLLTAGSRGEVMIWQFKTDSISFSSSFLSPFSQSRVDATLNQVTRVEPLDRSVLDNYRTSCRVSMGGCDKSMGPLLIALGGTSGFVHLLDASHGVSLQRWDAGESRQSSTASLEGCGVKTPAPDAVMAMAMLEEHILLAATASGSLTAFDVRGPPSQSVVWRTTLDPFDGPCSALCPLYNANRAFCFVAATYGGVSRLYDLRFSGLCVCRDDVATGLLEASGVSEATHYRAGEMNASNRSPNTRGTWNGDYLGTRWNVKARLSILCAAVDHTGIAFAMTSKGGHLTSSRTSPPSSSPEILFGMSSGGVCTLNLTSGKVYPLLQPSNNVPTRTMLIQPAYGSIFTASEDGYLRYWSTRQPATSHTLCCPPSSISSEYEAVRVKQFHLRDFGEDFLPAYKHVQKEQPVLAGWRYFIRERARFSSDIGGGNGKGKGVATAEPHPHHRDAILSMAAIQGVEGASARSGDRHQQFLASGARDGSLTVWANRSP